MTDQEKIRLLRGALKACLHRLEMEQQAFRSKGMNSNPREKVILEAYTALRLTQPIYEPVAIGESR